MNRLLQYTKFSWCNLKSHALIGTDLNSCCCRCYHLFYRRFVWSPREGVRQFHRTNNNSVTQISLSLDAKRKKRKQSMKKYAEILEVTNTTAKLRTALIKKFTSKTFQQLASQPISTDTNFFNDLSACYQHSESLRCYDPVVVLPPSHLDRFVTDYISDKQEIQIKTTPAVVPTKTQVTIDPQLIRQNIVAKFQNHKTLRKKLNSFKYAPKVKSPEEVSEYVVEEDVLKSSEVEDVLKSSEVEDVLKPAQVEDVEEGGLARRNVGNLIAKKKLKGYKTMQLKTDVKDSLAKQKSSVLQQKGKEECFNRNLLAYVDVCVNSNLTNIAFAIVKHYSVHRSDGLEIMNIEVYNTLLNAYAAKGMWQKVLEVLELIQCSKLKLKLNLGSYACILECASRVSEQTKSALIIGNYLKNIKDQSLTLQDLFNETKLVRDQHSLILKAIKKVEPGFVVQKPKLELNYDCQLLDKLNTRQTFVSPVEDGLTSRQLKHSAKEQINVELNGFVKIKTIEKREEPTDAILYYRQKLEETQEEWKKTIKDALVRDIKLLKLHAHNPRSFSLYPFMVSLSADEYVDILMQEVRKLAEGSETYSPMTVLLFRQLGEQVCIRYHVNCKKNKQLLSKLESVYNEYCDWFVDTSGTSSNTRQQWQSLLGKYPEGPSLHTKDGMWPNTVLIGVGKFLYNIIIRDLKIDVNVMRMNSSRQRYLPAFYTLFRNQGRVIKEEIKPHPVLSRLFRGASPDELVFHTSFVPMLCPPVPWTNINSGGYLITRTQLMRLPNQAVQQWDQLEKAKSSQLYPTLDSLNQLGAIPWRVNENILDILLKVFNDGGSSKLDVPEPPSALVLPETSGGNSFRQRLAVRRRKAEMYSLWCDTLYRLSLANHFRGRTFWLPHNMDFRGRTYPCPPHLNHLGSDMARSLLVFAKTVPLGPNGLDWIKIHLINLTGTKKKHSMQERLDYCNEMLPEILDSVERPLTGNMWWARSEEPWQTLAACFEIKKALDSGDPVNYVTGFPVHQDGSCNGLQHYAALGRDEAGGESVNLTPAEKPQDVYSCVVQIVERERKKDAANGVAIAQQLEGFVSRKVIKQTIMTTVYGVTRYGARLQIARQLKDIDEFPRSSVWQGSQYLVGKTFESLQEMFTSTKQIQDWFTECARLISQVCGQNVEWVTPLGLPIVQPYFKPMKNFVQKKNEDFAGVYHLDMYERPNVMKQKNAFPPNFIHSLDSSHMMLTSLHCERAGITFVSVHDCFWTHPSTVEIMNQICREEFVALHSQPLLQDLSYFFINKYGYDESVITQDGSVASYAKHRLNNTLKQVPKTGTLCLKDVLNSPYFFS